LAAEPCVVGFDRGAGGAANRSKAGAHKEVIRIGLFFASKFESARIKQSITSALGRIALRIDNGARGS
jgi:hypothetical protein